MPEVYTGNATTRATASGQLSPFADLRAPHGSGENGNDIGVLIGSDQYWKIATSTIHCLNGSLTAVDIMLGWTVQGMYGTPSLSPTTTTVFFLSRSGTSPRRSFQNVEVGCEWDHRLRYPAQLR